MPIVWRYVKLRLYLANFRWVYLEFHEFLFHQMFVKLWQQVRSFS